MASVECTGPGSWRVVEDWFNPPVRVPLGERKRTGDEICTVNSEHGWLCTRARGHSGRHAAACSNGDVMEVWHG